MADQKIKHHPKYGPTQIINWNGFLAEIETQEGDTFWVTCTSFILKKPVKRAKKVKKPQVVQQVDKPDELLVPALDLDLHLPDEVELLEDGMPPIEEDFEDQEDEDVCEEAALEDSVSVD